MPRIIHYDEAVNAVVQIARGLLERPWLSRIAIVDDLFGSFQAMLWVKTNDDLTGLEAEWAAIDDKLREECGPFWTGRRLVANESITTVDNEFFESAWRIGHRPAGASDRLRYVDRHRSRTSWFVPLHSGPSNVEAPQAPVVAFYSFKGGMGRTTAAAAYVVSQAKAGRYIVAIDLDLDAPGLGRLLSTERDGVPNPWGTVDFLLESRNNYPLDEYRHVCARPELVGDKPVDVFPVGKIDELYLRKLAKIDLDVRDDETVSEHPVAILIARIRAELRPDEIVVDCRAGLSPISGFMLTPLVDVHVVFSTASDQSLDGLARVVHRIGYDRLQAGLSQGECVLVQAMVPESTIGGGAAKSYFSARAEDIYRDHYYQQMRTDPTDDDSRWYLDDLGLADAPHRAIPIPYREPLADFRDLGEILAIVNEGPFREIAERIGARLRGLSDRPEAAADLDEV